MSQTKTDFNFKILTIILMGILFLNSIPTPAETLRSIASVTHSQRIYPTDFCSYNCDSDVSIHSQLIQNFNYVSSEENSQSTINKIMTIDTVVPGNATKTINKMADRSVKYFWDNSELKKSSIGRTVEHAQKSLQKEVSIGSSGRVEQKLNLVYDAFQSAARVQYSGYTDAELSYESRESSLALRMTEKISQNTNLELGEVIRPNDQVSQVMVKWNW